MANPWEEISLSEYEKHMKLETVFQLQTMNQMMEKQFNAYRANSVIILGVAGGNGLEHIDKEKFNIVYGVDINDAYLQVVKERYVEISDILVCIRLDLIEEVEKLPHAELLIANLLIEYIGYDCFQKAVRQIQPKYVSCIIQINEDNSWVSDSPYLKAFNCLDKVHHQITEDLLIQSMDELNYTLIAKIEKSLPNRKKLVQLDFVY